MRGFMAPPLKAEAKFFVLTEIPMSICPFCSSDADWPDNIVVVYLDEKQTFVQPNAADRGRTARSRSAPGPIRRPASSACCACATPNSGRSEPMLSLSARAMSRVSYPGLAAPVLDIAALAIAAGEPRRRHRPVRLRQEHASSTSSPASNAPAQGRVAGSGTDIAALSGSAPRPLAGGECRPRHAGFPSLSRPLAHSTTSCCRRGSRAPHAPVTSITGARAARRASGFARLGQPIETMSRGEMQRVAVARALLRKPGVIVADEPTASLDAESGDAVVDLLLELAAAGEQHADRRLPRCHG